MSSEFIINLITKEKAKFIEADDDGIYGIVQIGPQSFESVYWPHQEVINHSKEDIEFLLKKLYENLSDENLSREDKEKINIDIELFKQILLLF